MDQTYFAFYSELEEPIVSDYQDLPLTATMSTAAPTDGLWVWGDGVVTDPNKPEGEWAELAQYIRYDLEKQNFYYVQRDDWHKFRSLQKRKIRIASGLFLSKNISNLYPPVIHLPPAIKNILFNSGKIINKSIGFYPFKISIILPKIYRSYDNKNKNYIDHMDGDLKNNLPSNLRPVSAQQNAINSCKNKFSIPGVIFFKRDSVWISMFNYRRKTFNSELAAISWRKYQIKKAIADGVFEQHDLWAFEKRIEAAMLYRKIENLDCHGRKNICHASGLMFDRTTTSSQPL